MGNEELESGKEAGGTLARRYWITAVITLLTGFLPAFYLFSISEVPFENDELYSITGLCIGGLIGCILGRLILAAVTGEPRSRRLDFLFCTLVFGIPSVRFYYMFETVPSYFPALIIGAVLGPLLLKLFRLFPPNRFFLRGVAIISGGLILFGTALLFGYFFIDVYLINSYPFAPFLFFGLGGVVIVLIIIVQKQHREDPEILAYRLPKVVLMLVTMLTIGIPIGVIWNIKVNETSVFVPGILGGG